MLNLPQTVLILEEGGRVCVIKGDREKVIYTQLLRYLLLECRGFALGHKE